MTIRKLFFPFAFVLPFLMPSILEATYLESKNLGFRAHIPTSSQRYMVLDYLKHTSKKWDENVEPIYDNLDDELMKHPCLSYDVMFLNSTKNRCRNLMLANQDLIAKGFELEHFIVLKLMMGECSHRFYRVFTKCFYDTNVASAFDSREEELGSLWHSKKIFEEALACLVDTKYALKSEKNLLLAMQKQQLSRIGYVLKESEKKPKNVKKGFKEFWGPLLVSDNMELEIKYAGADGKIFAFNPFLIEEEVSHAKKAYSKIITYFIRNTTKTLLKDNVVSLIMDFLYYPFCIYDLSVFGRCYGQNILLYKSSFEHKSPPQT